MDKIRNYQVLIRQEGLKIVDENGIRVYIDADGNQGIALYSKYYDVGSHSFYGISQKKLDWLNNDKNRVIYLLSGQTIFKIPAVDFLTIIAEKEKDQIGRREFHIGFKDNHPFFMHNKVSLSKYLLEYEVLDNDDYATQEKIDKITDDDASKVSDGEYDNLNIVQQNQRQVIIKNPFYSKKAKINSKYRCEVDSSHETFISKTSSKQYVEGHHLIPCTLANAKYFMSAYGKNIDCVQNIVSLCPNCHRLIHLGSDECRRNVLEIIYDKRANDFKKIGITITLNDLLMLYGIN